MSNQITPDQEFLAKAVNVETSVSNIATIGILVGMEEVAATLDEHQRPMAAEFVREGMKRLIVGVLVLPSAGASAQPTLIQ
jgi:hypothetical protein